MAHYPIPHHTIPYHTKPYHTVSNGTTNNRTISVSRLTCVSAPGADLVLLLRLEEVFLSDLANHSTNRRGQFSATTLTNTIKYQARLMATLASLCRVKRAHDLGHASTNLVVSAIHGCVPR